MESDRRWDGFRARVSAQDSRMNSLGKAIGSIGFELSREEGIESDEKRTPVDNSDAYMLSQGFNSARSTVNVSPTDIEINFKNTGNGVSSPPKGGLAAPKPPVSMSRMHLESKSVEIPDDQSPRYGTNPETSKTISVVSAKITEKDDSSEISKKNESLVADVITEGIQEESIEAESIQRAHGESEVYLNDVFKCTLSYDLRCAYFYRHYSTLRKFEKLFYILDKEKSLLIEFHRNPWRKANEFGICSSLSARTIVDLKDARIEDEIVSHSGHTFREICFFNLHTKTLSSSGLPAVLSKVYSLGSESRSVVEQWQHELASVIKQCRTSHSYWSSTDLNSKLLNSNQGDTLRAVSISSNFSSGVDGMPTCEQALNDQTTTSRNLEAGESASASVTAKQGGIDIRQAQHENASCNSDLEGQGNVQIGDWEQSVRVCDELFKVRCSEASTNAWLLSEAIREYERQKKHSPSNELGGLLNATKHSLLDLGDDVWGSVDIGDVIEAISVPASYLADHFRQRSSKSLSKYHNHHNLNSSANGTGTVSKYLRESRLGSQYRNRIELPELSSLINVSEFNAAFAETRNFWSSIEESKLHLSRLFSQLLTLQHSMNNPVPFWPSKQWNQYGDSDAVLTFSTRSPSLPGTLGMTRIPKEPHHVFFAWMDANKHREWNPYIESARYLEASSTSDVVHFQTNRSLTWKSMNPFLFPREFCILRLWLKLADGSYIIVWCPIMRPEAGDSPRCGRFLSSVQATLAGSIAIRPVYRADSDRMESLVVHNCALEMKAFAFDKFFSRHAEQAITGALAGFADWCSCTLE